jgi:hypothetical protein
MKSRQRRLKAIELSLTPKQVVVVWLRNAMQAGTFEQGARHVPPYRGTVANAVLHSVRESMKGQPEPLVERAILQAHREADLLYLLVVDTNIAVLEGWEYRRREYVLLLGWLNAEMQGHPTKLGIQMLPLAVLNFIKLVIILDTAVGQVVSEHLDGQPVLFRDCEVKLQEQLQMAETLSKHFNLLAGALHLTGIDLAELRNSLQSATDRQVSAWVNDARVKMLSLLGTWEETHAALDHAFAFLEPKSGEGNVGENSRP